MKAVFVVANVLRNKGAEARVRVHAKMARGKTGMTKFVPFGSRRDCLAVGNRDSGDEEDRLQVAPGWG